MASHTELDAPEAAAADPGSELDWSTTQAVYFFGEGKADGRGDMKDVLGGKGAGLAEMTNAGVPVPPGYTITTDVCRYYYRHDHALPPGYVKQEADILARLEKAMGKKLGDKKDPLLVSVRSGAKFSMPGMMDTILNLGLNDQTVQGLAKKSGDERFAWDCYRRFTSMYGSVVLGLNKDLFEHQLVALKKKRKAELDLDLEADDFKDLVAQFKAIVKKRTGQEFPQDPKVQLAGARDAVFRSWMNDRAAFYRRTNDIPDDIGTGVNIQAMVFGNLGDNSGTGVGFTRNPATGTKEFYGEYLPNAQGEDVVAGVRTPLPLTALKKAQPKVFSELRAITDMLEKHYRDVQDFEFTIQEGRLYLLQTRIGKRTTVAAVKIAVDMVKEKLISKEEALLRIDPDSLNQLLHPQMESKVKLPVLGKGLPASPGAAVGKVVFTADEAERLGSAGEKVVLVRNETVPDDIHGMVAAQGILTATGGMTSHAAVVARGMGRCCVAGASGIHIDGKKGFLEAGGRKIKAGEYISLDGNKGIVYDGKANLVDPGFSGEFGEFMAWADEMRRLGVRANADVPKDARKARDFGATGIGLCRTEHMFFAEERMPHVVQMIMAAGLYKDLEQQMKAKQGEINREQDNKVMPQLKKELATINKKFKEEEKKFKGALSKILPFQRKDFRQLFEAMDGYPVTIRTLDPPLHEFLPKREDLIAAVASLETEIAGLEKRRRPVPKGLKRKLSAKKKILDRVEELHEFNPMLGHRGCRLGVTYPEVTAMQARAILEAALQAQDKGVTAKPEIMIPLVSHVREFVAQRKVVDEIAEELFKKKGKRIDYLVGTMIEVPRAALTAGEIAEVAEFFSFGTNDLTQMAFGFSRDDAGKFLPEYVTEGILPGDPFVAIDQIGVGRLVAMATEEGRQSREGLKVGICGEHGGEPSSVEFCHNAGLDYVSCSPFRVPIARLAAAQAAVRGKVKVSDSR
jgi:pyruvate,orthophosphate dikinase